MTGATVQNIMQYSTKSILTSLRKNHDLVYNSELYSVFIKLLNHKNKDVRLEVVKKIGMLKNKDNQQLLISYYDNEPDTMVKREYISSLGRQRNQDLINFFIEKLNEKDPKIVLQAIRSLLVFKDNSYVLEELKKMQNHPNEMIKEFLKIELTPSKKVKSGNHKNFNKKLKNTVVKGDVIEVLTNVEDESLHLTFTSPPYYNARDYSLYSSYEEYLNFLRDVFKEVHRLTKEGRFLIVNSSPIIIPRVSRSHSSKRYPIPFDINNFLTQDGWEFIDDIIWKKPEYSVKNRVGGFQQHKKPLGYKPNCVTEYLMVYRKKSDKLIDWNMKQYDLNTIEKSKILGDFETTNVWNIDPTFDKTHSAVFPKGLCERIIKYYSYEGDLIFDPFGGSGTLGEVSLETNRNFFLTEIDDLYYERIKEKLKKYSQEKNINYFNNKDFKKWIKQES